MIVRNIKKLLRKNERDLVVMSGVTFGAPVANFIATIFITRFLDPSEFGLYVYLLSFINLFLQITNLGVYPTIRFITGQLASKKEITRMEKGMLLLFFAMSLITSFASVIGVIVIYFSNNDLPIEIFFYACTFIFIHVAISLYDNFYQGAGDILKLSKLRLYPKLIFLGFISAFLWLQPSAWFLFTLLQFALLLSLLLVMHTSIKNFLEFDTKYFWFVIEKTKTFGLGVYIGSIVFLAGIQLIPFVISSISSNSSDVGYYGVAMTLSAPLVMIPQIISTVFFKDFVNKDYIEKELIIILLFIIITIFIFFYFSSNYLISTIFGSKYLPSVDFFKLLIIFNLFHGINLFLDRYFHAKGNSKVVRDSSIYAGFILVIALYFFTNYFDALGVCWALIASSAAAFCIKLFAYLNNNNQTQMEKIE